MPNNQKPINPPLPPWELLLRIALVALVALVLARAFVSQLRQVHFSSPGRRAAGTAQGYAGFREVASFSTACRQPRGLAIALDGTVYVAGDRCVNVFSADGKPLSALTLDGEPHCLALANGLLYVGLQDRIEVYKGGALTARWGGFGPRAYLTALASAPTGLWVADAGNRAIRLLRFTDGNTLATVGVADKAHGVPGLLIPSPHLDIAVDKAGLLWATNPGRYRVEAYSQDNRLQHAWGESSEAIDGFSGCCNPTNLALLPDGRVVTSEKGTPRVKLYNKEGKYLGLLADEDAFPPGDVGLSLAIDGKGRVLVLDPLRHCVRVFQKS